MPRASKNALLVFGFFTFGAIMLSIAILGDKNVTTIPDQQSQSAPPPIDKSPKLQKGRLDLINGAIKAGVFDRIEADGPRVYVRAPFYGLDFKDKALYIAVVYAYYFDGSNSGDMVHIRDVKTNKSVGWYSYNLGLSLK